MWQHHQARCFLIWKKSLDEEFERTYFRGPCCSLSPGTAAHTDP